MHGVQDAMETTAQSEDKGIAEELLHFFVDAGEKEAFAAMLFTCYDLIQPDVALEVRAWAPGCILPVSLTQLHWAPLVVCHPCCPSQWLSLVPVMLPKRRTVQDNLIA